MRVKSLGITSEICGSALEHIFIQSYTSRGFAMNVDTVDTKGNQMKILYQYLVYFAIAFG